MTELHGQHATLTSHTPKNKFAHVTVNHSPAFSMAVFSGLLITADSLQAQNIWRVLLRMLHQDMTQSFCNTLTEKQWFLFHPKDQQPTCCPSTECSMSISQFQSINVLHWKQPPTFFPQGIFRHLNESKRDVKPQQLKRHLSQGSRKVGVVDSHC